MGLLSIVFAVQLTAGVTGVEYLQPQMAANAEMVALAFGAKNTVYFAKSADQGRSFSKPVKVAEGGRLSLGFHRGPRVEITPGAIVISAVVGEKGGGADGDLIAWHSTDGGATWSDGVRVNDVVAAAREGLHSMAAGGRNTLFAVWLDLRSKGTKLYGSVSTDGGATWSENRLVYASPSGTVCQCCHPTVLVDADGAITVMFRNVIGGVRDMHLVRSTDSGKTFSEAQKVGDGSWEISGCPADGGGMAIGTGGELTSVWRRKKEVYRTTAGATEELIGTGKNPVVAVAADGRYIAWKAPAGIVALTPNRKKPVVLDPAGRYVTLLAQPGGGVLAAWQSGGTMRIEQLR